MALLSLPTACRHSTRAIKQGGGGAVLIMEYFSWLEVYSFITASDNRDIAQAKVSPFPLITTTVTNASRRAVGRYSYRELGT